MNLLQIESPFQGLIKANIEKKEVMGTVKRGKSEKENGKFQIPKSKS